MPLTSQISLKVVRVGLRWRKGVIVSREMTKVFLGLRTVPVGRDLSKNRNTGADLLCHEDGCDEIMACHATMPIGKR